MRPIIVGSISFKIIFVFEDIPKNVKFQRYQRQVLANFTS